MYYNSSCDVVQLSKPILSRILHQKTTEQVAPRLSIPMHTRKLYVSFAADTLVDEIPDIRISVYLS